MKYNLLTTTLLSAVMVATLSAADNSARSADRIARETNHEISMLSNYGVFDDIKFQVTGDNVTLLGVVRQPVLKGDAEKAVKSIEGVGKVDNRIEVLPVSPEDDRIRLATYRAIYGNPVLDRYGLNAVLPIHIVVKNGDVTLSGIVSTELDKTAAFTSANGVSGAHHVQNDLRIVK